MRIQILALLALTLTACSRTEPDSHPPEQVQAAVRADRYENAEGTLQVALVKQPYHGGRNVAELSRNPDYLEEGGLADSLRQAGFALKDVASAELTPEESGKYGEWHRMGLANGHLADLVAANEKDGFLTVGLLGNCNALMGMLGGFQHAGEEGEDLTIGLIWVDAHGDFNTPETTLSGMLGGMPVAVSAGLALDRLRRESHLDPPIATDHIVMVSVRDTDPEEEALIQEHGLARLSTEDVRSRSAALHDQMASLSRNVDLIYVHIDMDVLDPREVPGHGLNVPGGPTSQELASALTEIFRYPKVAGLGIASTPAYDADPDGLSRAAAYRLIQGALDGVAAR
jgi:arginase